MRFMFYSEYRFVWEQHWIFFKFLPLLKRPSELCLATSGQGNRMQAIGYFHMVGRKLLDLILFVYILKGIINAMMKHCKVTTLTYTF